MAKVLSLSIINPQPYITCRDNSKSHELGPLSLKIKFKDIFIYGHWTVRKSLLSKECRCIIEKLLIELTLCFMKFIKQRKSSKFTDLWIFDFMNDEIDWKFFIIICGFHTSSCTSFVIQVVMRQTFYKFSFSKFSFLFHISFTATKHKLTAYLSTLFFVGEELELFYY